MPTLSPSKNQGSRAGTRDIYHILAVCAARDYPQFACFLDGLKRTGIEKGFHHSALAPRLAVSSRFTPSPEQGISPGLRASATEVA